MIPKVERELMSIPSATLSKIDNLLFGIPRLESIRGSSTNAKDSKPHYIVKKTVDNIDNAFSLPESSPFLRYHPVPRRNEGKSHQEVNHTKKGEEEDGEEGDGKEKTNRGEFHNFSILDSSNITSNKYPCLRLNPYVVLGIVGFVVLCACCCTLFIRRKIVNCLNCFKFKKKKNESSGKYIPIDAESGQGSTRWKKKSGKSKNQSSKNKINTATQDSNASVLKVEEELPSTGCCQCCKKKGKKNKKRKK